MEQIKSYFNNLPGNFKNPRGYDSVVNLYLSKSKSVEKHLVYISINRQDFLKNIFIPFLDSLSWRCKKWLDYQDWKAILSLKELGQHYSEAGKILIDLILSQMNNKRLSTNLSHNSPVDRVQLYAEINKLLAAPSNFEVKEDGRIFIKSLNKYYSPRENIKVKLANKDGLIVNTFNSIVDCAKFLGIYPAMVKRRLVKSEPVLFNDKLLYIKRADFE